MLGAAFEVARSGLAAESLRAQVAAINIANASTPDHEPLTIAQSSEGTGGVRVSVQPAGADHIGSVDLPREFTSLVYAQAAYTANLAVIETADEMFQTLFDVIHDDDGAGVRNRG